VTVTAGDSTTGVLEAWEREGGQFVRVHGPTEVYVGSDGVGNAADCGFDPVEPGSGPAFFTHLS
jgi:hypothetical protein